MVTSSSRKCAVKTHYNQLAHSYSSRYEGRSALAYAFRIYMHRVCELFDGTKGRVLDVGCGSGDLVDWLLRRECHVYGLDISKEMIGICVERFKNAPDATFAVGEIEKLPFKNYFFDSVVCKGVMDFVDDESLVVAELARVVKPGSSVLVTFQHLFSPWRLWTKYVARLRRPVNLSHRSYRAGSVAKLLQSHGFVVEDVVYCDFQLFLKPLDRLFPGPAVWVAQTLEKFCRSRPLSWMATGFVVKATKRQNF